MAKFSLPIKSTYVPDWGTWHAIRELVQNAKDEEEHRGHSMRVFWDRTDAQHGILTINNEGADMDRKALLIGHTTKAGVGLRGRFGEGLDLAMLAAVRAGHKLVIETQTERWTPEISYSDEYGASCLAVQTRALKVRRSGVTISMTLDEADWQLYRERFLFLAKISDDQIVRVPEKGAILTQPERKGHVYVKGIYVDTLPKLECGYDLDNCELDRDRRMINVWDLQWNLGSMYSDAMARRPGVLGGDVYRMLRDDAEDTKLMQHFITDAVADQVSASFIAEHGANAVPVTSMAESAELEHLGKRGVVVPTTLRDVVKKTTGDTASIKAALANQVTATHAWGDLLPSEQATLLSATTALDAACKGLRDATPIMERLDVVSFRDVRLQGLCNLVDGRIQVARDLLADPREFLKTLVHEEAHAFSAAGDGAKGHVATIEEVWSRLYHNAKAV